MAVPSAGSFWVLVPGSCGGLPAKGQFCGGVSSWNRQAKLYVLSPPSWMGGCGNSGQVETRDA